MSKETLTVQGISFVIALMVAIIIAVTGMIVYILYISKFWTYPLFWYIFIPFVLLWAVVLFKIHGDDKKEIDDKY